VELTATLPRFVREHSPKSCAVSRYFEQVRRGLDRLPTADDVLAGQARGSGLYCRIRRQLVSQLDGLSFSA